MKKKINFFTFFFLFLFSFKLIANEIDQSIEPEPDSIKSISKKTFVANNFILVTANDYATTIGFQVLKDGGNAVDSAIAVQLVLGLVEPQSSGIGGGTFITFFDAKTKKLIVMKVEKSHQKKFLQIFLLIKMVILKNFLMQPSEGPQLVFLLP